MNKTKPPEPSLREGGIKKPELLAPAGNLEKMKTAFAFGADAVYAGIPDFSLRVRINDFTVESLKEAVAYAHKLGKNFYVTANIFAHNRHIEKLGKHIRELKKIKPDGIFVSDPGAIREIRRIWPKANIILSTQANCTNWQAVKFWSEQGIKRVILDREVSLDEIREIKKKAPKVELESFVHGALCMAYSGRCFLSKYLTGRSANLGDCAQPCRWPYARTNSDLDADSCGQEGGIMIKPVGRNEVLEIVEEEHGSYILNSNDLCLIKKIPELTEAGLNAFKIEGRAKSVYYLATVVGAYRKAIDVSHNVKRITHNARKELNFLYKELEEKLNHRGYTEGFMFETGKLAQNLKNSHNGSNWEFCGQAIKVQNSKTKNQNYHRLGGIPPAMIKIKWWDNSKFKNKKFISFIKIHNSLHIGDSIEIIMPGYDIIKMKVKKMVDAMTGETLTEAHGGQNSIIKLETKAKIPEFSVLRRKL